MIRHALNDAWPWLALIGGGVLLLATFARDPKANEHELADYHEPSVEDWDYVPAPIPTQRRPWAEMNAKPERDILPPAPPGMNAGTPLYAGMLFDTWHPESPSDTADRFLRELRDEALAGAR